MTIASALLVLVLSQAASAPSIPANQGTAVVRGKVVDKQSGAPIARALVTLRGIKSPQLQQTLTNQQGAFEFNNLAGGDYELRATAGEFRATHVPAALRAAPNQPGPLLQLTDGEKREDIVLALPRAMAISGRVTDENGQPLANVEITLPASSGPGLATRSPTTDDRGVFRIYGLGAGRHVVCATVRRGPSFDPKPQRRPQYMRTCYPSVMDPEQATEITLADQDVGGIEIQLQRSASFVISGHVLSSVGGPADNANIQINRIERNHSSGTGTTLQAGGAFTISNVAPGTYEVSARLGRSVSNSTADEREPEWASVRLDITSADVEGLVLQLKKGVNVKGRVVFEDPPPAPPTSPLQVTVTFDGLGANRPGMGPQRGTVSDDGTFELKGLFGPVSLLLFGAGVPRGYTLKSVMYRGQDIRHMAVEFDGDPAHQVELVLTNRTAEVSGLVLDDQGKPVTAASVIHFPADPARWKGFQGSRTMTSPQGRYRIPQLVAGEYLVVAVSADDQRVLALPDDFDRLAAVAQRVPVLENERRTADLPLSSIPPRRKD